MTNKIALLNDNHIGCRGDASVFLDFQEKFFKDVFFPKIDAEGITTVANLGDLWDRRKYVNFGTLKRAREFLFEPLKERNLYCPTILGNHDVFHKNNNKTNSIDLLLRDYKNIELIEEPRTIHFGNTPVSMIPWISADNEKRCFSEMETTTATICFGHFGINGFVMHVGQVCEDGIDRNIFDKFEMVLSGHFHHRSTDGRIYYLGSQYEMTWSDYGDQKGFHILDMDTREIEFIPNPYSMFHRIVYNEKKPLPKDLEQYRNVYVKVVVENKKSDKKFDAFMQSLYDVNPYDLKIVENYVDVNELPEDVHFDQSENTLTLLNTYIDHATMSEDIDKTNLKSLMMEIYNESLQMEI